MAQLNCPSCNRHTDHQVLYAKNGSIVRRCSTCGLGSAEPRYFQPEAYYTEDYFNGGCNDGYADYVGSESVLRAEFTRTVEVLKRYCRPKGRLLEIGCAYGYFLQEAQFFYEPHGIELAKEAVEACHRAGLMNVHEGIADEATLDQIGLVDAIILLDVIEHLPAPFETLRLCNRILKPGGVILITTGDFGSVVACLAGRRWRLMTPPQHLWFFSRKSIANICSTLGLDMVAFSKPWKWVPVSLILFQIARMAGFHLSLPAKSLLSQAGIPVNVFDTMRVVLRKPIGKA